MNLATGLRRELESKLATIGRRLTAATNDDEMRSLISERKGINRAIAFLDSRNPALCN